MKNQKKILEGVIWFDMALILIIKKYNYMHYQIIFH